MPEYLNAYKITFDSLNSESDKNLLFFQSFILSKDFSTVGTDQEWNLQLVLWPLFNKAKHYNSDDFPSNTMILFHITDTWIYPP